MMNGSFEGGFRERTSFQLNWVSHMGESEQRTVCSDTQILQRRSLSESEKERVSDQLVNHTVDDTQPHQVLQYLCSETLFETRKPLMVPQSGEITSKFQ